MKSCSAMRQLSKIVIMFCMLLLPHTTDTIFQMSTQEQNMTTYLSRDVLLPCTFRTQGNLVDTEFIIVTWTHNNKEIARYKAGDVLITSKALLFETTDTRFQMSTQEHSVISSLNRDVLLPCIFRTQGDFVDTESIIVTWSHNTKEIARYRAGDVVNTSKALLFERELQRGNASLLLKNFQVEDKGEYICRVVDVPDEGQIRIRLEELPKMMIVPDILVRGIDQIISCIIDGHLPEEISITWKKNGVPLRKTKTKDDGTFITTESLMLNPVDENDEFTCEVKVMNEIISTTKKFQFTGNSLSLAGIGNIVLSIILILMLILIALYIWYQRGKKRRMKAIPPVEECLEIQTLNAFKNCQTGEELYSIESIDIENSGESDHESVCCNEML